MGLGKSMKRKLSFSNLTKLKTAQPTMSPRYDYDDDSPPYSPTASEMERPAFTAQALKDLKQSCAILVTMTNPPDPEDEPDHGEYLRRLEAERKAKHERMRATEAKSMKADLRQVKLEEVKAKVVQTGPARKEPPKRYSTRRPRQDSKDASDSGQHHHYVPKDPNGRHKPNGDQPKSPETAIPLIMGEPVLPPVHAPIVERIKEQQLKVRAKQEAEAARTKQELARRKEAEGHALGHIRKSMHIRPKTSAAACVDYEGDPISFSSNSSSRSNSDYAAMRGRPTSTGLTSLQAQTPSMIDGRSSRKDRRPSEGGSGSDSTKEIQDLARQRADEYSANRGSRPPSRQSKLSRMTSRSDLSSIRPSSRAGSFASSIADNINNYIRNRHNTPAEGSIRSGRSSSLGFRSRSRSSSMSRRSSSSGWWRNGGLRRRGSWASFRSGGGEGKERNKLRKDGGPNLNRPLPALPGLDQYKEAKTHIGQLVKKKKVKKSKIGEPQPLVPIDHPYVPQIPGYVRSNSNLGYYGVSSAPLLDTDGNEKEFPRFDQLPLEQGERRSTAPETHQAKREKAAKMTRSSLNPIKPRRGSVTVDTSENPEHVKRLPPPIIRGPSYKRELENGVYPRRMEVNDGGGHVILYDSVGSPTGEVVVVEENGGLIRRKTEPADLGLRQKDGVKEDFREGGRERERGDKVGKEKTGKGKEKEGLKAEKKEKELEKKEKKRGKGLGMFGGGGGGREKEREGRRVVIAH